VSGSHDHTATVATSRPTAAPAHDFKGTAAAALAAAGAVLSHWLPDGKHQGHEYQALNPTRADGKPGSFSINTNTGQWADFATDDKGGDLVSLVPKTHERSSSAVRDLRKTSGG
jgi:putative DNA primase/helicase